MKHYLQLLVALGLLGTLAACGSLQSAPDAKMAKEQVVSTERAFAKTMAERNHQAFAAFISEEAVFFSGPTPLLGKDAVVKWWTRYFVDPAAPFSWEPDDVEVLASGSLALSSGPVRDPTGKLIGRFTSVWRQEAPSTWRIVFDKGDPVCDDARK
jgi:ketosteroid isomerase-like protein